jgi:hypothetical protein
LAAGALWVGALPARAGLTDVRPAANGEVGHEQILERLYGVDFAASGAGYSGGGIDVSRVDDGADRVVSFDEPRRVDLVAAFTGWEWDIGLEDTSGRRVATASQNGIGFDATGGFDVPAGSGPLALTIEHASGRQYRSGDSLDQLVTYEVSGAGGEGAVDDTLFFWENWSRREGSDADFNDLVLRSTAGVDGGGLGEGPAGGGGNAPAATSIPLPSAAWPGAVGLFGVTWVAVRRYRKRR